MMGLAEFDDPQALRTRFDDLCKGGASSGGFPGLPQIAFEQTGGEPGRFVSASICVPSEAPFFADHFPRRPVFPGSLLMHLNLQLGAVLASELPPPGQGRWVPATIQDMKLRSFIPPGATLQLEAKLKRCAHDSASLTVETRTAKEVIATAGLLLCVGDAV
jgi:3-hydroxymyristoyl/3-hydroxydecanoyl-(acyl carrier protein) dehydratase